MEELLDIPILYLSRFINQNKGEYYRLLQKVRSDNAWEEWVLFVLDAVEQTSLQAIRVIQGIKELMFNHKSKIRTKLPKIYSQDLINNIFNHPYTKIEFVMQELGISRPTATRYLEELTQINILNKHKLGKESYYINHHLFNLLANVSQTNNM